MQQELFTTVLGAYKEGETDNKSLYRQVAKQTGTDIHAHVQPVGKAGRPTNVFTRKVRWAQQSLKRQGLIEKVGHGQWRLTTEGKYTLTQIHMDKYMVAAHTDLGAVIWGNSANVFGSGVITEDVHLCLTSPPYLGIQRSYGTHNDEDRYIDFILSIMEPIRRRMVRGANIALNLTNDAFLKNQHGARSLYLEKLRIRMVEQLGLFLMDRVIWNTENKCPGPVEFVSKQETHLNTKYEIVDWYCNDPKHCIASNRNVLKAYTPQMKKLIEQGGEKVGRDGNDSKHGLKPGAFGKDNGGTIPGNVLHIGTTCTSKRALQKLALAQGLPVHSATYPLNLAKFLIKWLCPINDGLVVDCFGGWSTTGEAAESLGQPWLTVELHWEYIKASLNRFEQRNGYYVNPVFAALDDPLVRRQFAAA